MNNNLFGQPPIDGHLSCLQPFSLTNNAAVNNFVHILFWVCADVSVYKFPEVELLGQNLIYVQFCYKLHVYMHTCIHIYIHIYICYTYTYRVYIYIHMYIYIHSIGLASVFTPTAMHEWTCFP